MADSEVQSSKKDATMQSTCIAGKKTIENWEALVKDDKKEDKNIEKIDWSGAFTFFEKRIETRYLNPIKCIQNMSLNIGEGFAMVNLQCSLIETIESFYNGWVYNNNKFYKNGEIIKCPLTKNNLRVGDVFISFFKNEPTLKSGYFKNY
jgi:predicted nuclease of restriction endonuclease-like (RecB) superfamily